MDLADCSAASSTTSEEPPPVVTRPGDRSVLVLVDHASNHIPAEFAQLGLPDAELQRHVAYDIGALATAEVLAEELGATLIHTTTSRLVIDPNRGEDDPTLVMRIADGAVVPGNASIDQVEIARRRDRWHRPYQEAIAAEIDIALAEGHVPALVAMHSFTPFWKGWPRPWHVGMLWDKDPRIARPLVDAFTRNPYLRVGDNEPYDGALKGDTLYMHGTARGLPHVLIEVRQDLIADANGATEWGRRLAEALRPILAQPDVRRIEHFGSRAG
jgi:predicted N-formylglutamate amidohydrolase